MRTRSFRLTFAAVAALVLALPVGAIAADPRQDVIVSFRDGVAQPAALAAALTKAHGTTPTHVYRHALQGFAASLPASAVRALRARADVRAVTIDAAVTLADTTQSPATWGIDRIDQRDLPLSNSYTYGRTGAGVEAYVIDTGILFAHQEFGGRASLGIDVINDGRNGVDCHSHGTHVAGTIGGQTYGVAKAVTLKAVRVFDCAGNTSWSLIIQGVDFVTGQKLARPATPMVANMSISGPPDDNVDLAVSNSIAAGVSYAIAAGNGNIFGIGVDACGVSPARVPAALTVGATTSSDARAIFSNYGSCVDWFAPGVGIVSAGISSTTATATKQGTSMAAPHTAGVAALYLETTPAASAAQVRTALFDLTTKNKVGSANSTNAHLLYTSFPSSGNQPPVANDRTLTTGEDTAASWTPSVSDPDAGANLTCTIATQGSKGSATVASDCSTGTYTPIANANGSDAFTYRVSDGTASDTGVVSVTITASNDPPVAANDSYSTPSGTALVRVAPGVLGNDSDVEGGPLTAVLAGGPSHGSLTLDAGGGFTYTPAAGYTGPDAFTYRAQDGAGALSAPATVSLTVTAPGATTMRVTDLDATAARKGQKWTMSVTIEVRNDLGALVSGATVTGSFTGGGGTNRTCVTSGTGRCTITSLQAARTVTSMTFTVTSVSHATLTYTAANSDPDGDSDGTTITRARP